MKFRSLLGVTLGALAGLASAAMADGRFLESLEAGWSSTGPQWLGGFRFFDPFSAFDGGVTTGEQLGILYLAHVRSSFDPGMSVPVEVRFDANTLQQRAYRLRRTGAGTSYRIQDTNPFVHVPFSVWDVSDPTTPRQLTVAWRDQDNDGTWNPPEGEDGIEVVFVYYRTYDGTGMNQFAMPPNAIDDELTTADIMYGLSLQVLSGHSLSESPGTLSIRPQLSTQVTIDIRPGDAENAINCQNPKALVPVAILSTADFDATQVDPVSVQFGPAGAVEIHGTGHLEDVDGDGELDMLFHFRFGEAGLSCEDHEGTLVGATVSGERIRGTDILAPSRIGPGVSGSGAQDRNDLVLAEDPAGVLAASSFEAGLNYFPNGTRNSYLYAAGVWIGGLVDGVPIVSMSMDPRGLEFDFVPSEIGNTGQPFRMFNSSFPNDRANWPPEFSSPSGTPIIVGGAQNIVAEFNDSAYPGRVNLGVEVRQRSLAYSDEAKRTAIIFIWDVTNISTRSISSAYFAFAADPDIGDASDDQTSSAGGMALAWDSDFFEDAFTEQPAIIGFHMLETPGATVIYATSWNALEGEPQSNAERYEWLSVPGHVNTDVRDVRMYLSTGPFDLSPGQTVRVAGTLVAGRAPAGTASLAANPTSDDPALTEIMTARDAVQGFYDKRLRGAVPDGAFGR